jgi:Tfp pilus assembly protein PilN
MPSRSTFGFLFVITVLIVVGGVMLLRQHEQTLLLRAKLELARAEAEELRRLRGEKARLLQRQIPVAELEALRADHAALARLRAELEAINKN